MKKLLLSLSILLIFSFYNCSEDDGATLVYLRAAIHTNCNNDQNFSGTDIYGYEVNDDYIGTYWQVGAHPANAVDEEPDLGMNIFNADLESGDYSITGDSWSANSVFVYYIDAQGNQYVSYTNLEGVVDISNDGSTVTIKVTTNVTLYNYETQQTICVSNFEARIAIN
ncbi:hypothetical protein WJN01_00835 [Flavobacteriaceae bacterium SZ-1-7]|uniref:hypothetical protein n=1 Tax=Tamlana sedimenti TaxID=3134126 RepID=UPI0031214126